MYFVLILGYTSVIVWIKTYNHLKQIEFMSRQHELANLLCDFELERMSFDDFDLHV